MVLSVEKGQYQYQLLPLGLSLIMIVLAKTFVLKKRQTILRSKFWKLQFVCHPILVGGLVYLTPISQIAVFVLVPIAFNFGVEPFEISKDTTLQLLLYLHHLAPVLAASMVRLQDENSPPSLSLAQAVLFGHAWMLHPIARLDKKGIIDKQQCFWPYIIVGFVLKCSWWKDPALVRVQVRMPIALQYASRWGLYLRACWLYGWHHRSHPNFDAFEWNKQFVEVFCFGTAFLLKE